MAPIADDIRDITAQYDALGYWAQGGDNDRDGTPDRADVNDGNGVDCSGWSWFLWSQLAGRGHYTGVPPIPLGSTSTYSAIARDRGWLVNLNDVAPGDVVIYAKNHDPYHSDGPNGHVGVVQAVHGPTLVTSESRGHQGVGLYPRDRAWWTLAYRIPDPSQEDDFMATLTDDEKRELLASVHNIAALCEEIKTPGNLPWSGALLKIADIHKIASDARDAFTGSAKKILDAGATGLAKGIATLRQNVFDIKTKTGA